jgi:flagellar biosynthesis chaperone FliJ
MVDKNVHKSELERWLSEIKQEVIAADKELSAIKENLSRLEVRRDIFVRVIEDNKAYPKKVSLLEEFLDKINTEIQTKEKEVTELTFELENKAQSLGLVAKEVNFELSKYEDD